MRLSWLIHANILSRNKDATSSRQQTLWVSLINFMVITLQVFHATNLVKSCLTMHSLFLQMQLIVDLTYVMSGIQLWSCSVLIVNEWWTDDQRLFPTTNHVHWLTCYMFDSQNDSLFWISYFYVLVKSNSKMRWDHKTSIISYNMYTLNKNTVINSGI